MKRIVTVVFLLAVLSIAGYASPACVNSVFLDSMTGAGFACYIYGGGGFPDILFSNFTYTPSGGAPAASLVTVSTDSGFSSGVAQTGFAFATAGGWVSGQGFTLTYTATVCTVGCPDLGAGGSNVYSFHAATGQANTFLNAQGLAMTNSFGTLNLSLSNTSELVKLFAGNPSGISTDTYSIFYAGGGGGAGITLNSYQGDIYTQDALIPEPVTMLLVGGGLLGVALLANKRRKKEA